MSRIDGWKNIAAYLGRTIRTVQRWERDDHLPVRRLGADRHESVFAFTEELDAWLESGRGASARREPEEAAAPVRSAGAAGPATPRRRRPPTVLLAVAVAVAAAAVAAGALSYATIARARHCEGPPTAWRVDGHTFMATDARGRVCWTFLLPAETSAPGDSRVRVLGGAVDLDGDARREFWVISRPGRDGATTLYCLREDGTLRWSYQPRASVVFGGRRIDGPWSVTGLFVTEDPAGSARPAIWVTAGRPADVPAMLTRFDVGSGRPVGEPFWHAGPIRTLVMIRRPAGPMLAVGASSAEFAAPVLLVIDAASPGGMSDAALPQFRCGSCVGRLPWASVVFPRPDRFALAPGAGTVSGLAVGGDSDLLAVDVDYLAVDGLPSATATFRLDRQLRITARTAGPDYARAYDILVRDRLVPDRGPVPETPDDDLPGVRADVRPDGDPTPDRRPRDSNVTPSVAPGMSRQPHQGR